LLSATAQISGFAARCALNFAPKIKKASPINLTCPKYFSFLYLRHLSRSASFMAAAHVLPLNNSFPASLSPIPPLFLLFHSPSELKQLLFYSICNAKRARSERAVRVCGAS
jgi:hypothetical protein